MAHPVPSRPFEKIGADIFSLSKWDFMLVVDYFSTNNVKRCSGVADKPRDAFMQYGMTWLIPQSSPLPSKCYRA